MASVFFKKKVAKPRLEAMKEDASFLAERCGLKEQDWWHECRGDEIVFVFAKGDKGGRDAANIFAFNWKLLKPQGEW
jgi:hypothetical protein